MREQNKNYLVLTIIDITEQKEKASDNQELTSVMVMGVFAGGLKAVQQLLFYLDEKKIKSHYAIIIVQPLSPDYKSLMAEIFSNHTKLEVTQATNEMVVKAGIIYLNAQKIVFHTTTVAYI